MDSRRNSILPPPLNLNDDTVEVVTCYKYLHLLQQAQVELQQHHYHASLGGTAAARQQTEGLCSGWLTGSENLQLLPAFQLLV